MGTSIPIAQDSMPRDTTAPRLFSSTTTTSSTMRLTCIQTQCILMMDTPSAEISGQVIMEWTTAVDPPRAYVPALTAEETRPFASYPQTILPLFWTIIH